MQKRRRSKKEEVGDEEDKEAELYSTYASMCEIDEWNSQEIEEERRKQMSSRRSSIDVTEEHLSGGSFPEALKVGGETDRYQIKDVVVDVSEVEDLLVSPFDLDKIMKETEEELNKKREEAKGAAPREGQRPDDDSENCKLMVDLFFL